MALSAVGNSRQCPEAVMKDSPSAISVGPRSFKATPWRFHLPIDGYRIYDPFIKQSCEGSFAKVKPEGGAFQICLIYGEEMWTSHHND